MERIACTLDELTEAVAAVLPQSVEVCGAGLIARGLASFIKADRMPEPPGKDDDDSWIWD